MTSSRLLLCARVTINSQHRPCKRDSAWENQPIFTSRWRPFCKWNPKHGKKSKPCKTEPKAFPRSSPDTLATPHQVLFFPIPYSLLHSLFHASHFGNCETSHPPPS